MRVGLLINPMAGIGGPAGLKGSDGPATVALAIERGSEPLAQQRVDQFLIALGNFAHQCSWFCWGGAMGANSLRKRGITCVSLQEPASPSSALDTLAATRALADQRLDLLLFAGGDGTARDVASALPALQLVLGIPAGAKMRSAVFAITPAAAAWVLTRLLRGEQIRAEERDIRDLDEAALRQGRIESKWFGSLRVPVGAGFVAHTKVGGRESEGLAQAEIAADIKVWARDYDQLFLGPGTTVMAIKESLCGQGTLLGVDVVRDNQAYCLDASASDLLQALSMHGRTGIVVSPTAGQGSVFGRGNQPLSAEVIRRVGSEHIRIVATRSKLISLAGAPLWVDTGDELLDVALARLTEIVVGFEDYLLYRVSTFTSSDFVVDSGS